MYHRRRQHARFVVLHRRAIARGHESEAGAQRAVRPARRRSKFVACGRLGDADVCVPRERELRDLLRDLSAGSIPQHHAQPVSAEPNAGHQDARLGIARGRDDGVVEEDQGLRGQTGVRHQLPGVGVLDVEFEPHASR